MEIVSLVFIVCFLVFVFVFVFVTVGGISHVNDTKILQINHINANKQIHHKIHYKENTMSLLINISLKFDKIDNKI